MYGLICENFASYIKKKWGEGKYEAVMKNCKMSQHVFSIHHIYPETFVPKMAKSACEILGVSEEEFFKGMGEYFIAEYIGQFGYDNVLNSLGRYMRHFLNGLDDLHEYLKYSYPKIRAPSFNCTDETQNGLVLHYRTKRRGYKYYAMGLIKEIGGKIYGIKVDIVILNDVLDEDTHHVTFQLTFNNRAYAEKESLQIFKTISETSLPIKSAMIFELFPFSMAFSDDMVIRLAGHKLIHVVREIIGQRLNEAFELLRPLTNLNFQNILIRRNNVFEVITQASINDDDWCSDDEDDSKNYLKLKGQMIHMEEWGMIFFLAKPAVNNLDDLRKIGLYLNDLTLHNLSRDLVIRGTQQLARVKIALAEEKEKSKKIEGILKEIEMEKKKSSQLIYDMIPQTVVETIMKFGKIPKETTKNFEMVTILYSKIEDFEKITSQIAPERLVSLLNHTFSMFDQLTEFNGVNKLESYGDVFMAVCGAPIFETNHAEKICDLALDMLDAANGVRNPLDNLDKESIKIKIGINSGPITAGVVGIKSPRFALFGPTVIIASEMEQSCKGGNILMSEKTKKLLPSMYQDEICGKINIKGQGEIETYQLKDRNKRVPLSDLEYSSNFSWDEPNLFQHDRALASIAAITYAPSSPTKSMATTLSQEEDYIMSEFVGVEKSTHLRKKSDSQIKRDSGFITPTGERKNSESLNVSSASFDKSPEINNLTQRRHTVAFVSPVITISRTEDEPGEIEESEIEDNQFEKSLELIGGEIDDFGCPILSNNSDGNHHMRKASLPELILKKVKQNKIGEMMIEMGCPGFAGGSRRGSDVLSDGDEINKKPEISKMCSII